MVPAGANVGACSRNWGQGQVRLGFFAHQTRSLAPRASVPFSGQGARRRFFWPRLGQFFTPYPCTAISLELHSHVGLELQTHMHLPEPRRAPWANCTVPRAGSIPKEAESAPWALRGARGAGVWREAPSLARLLDFIHHSHLRCLTGGTGLWRRRSRVLFNFTPGISGQALAGLISLASCPGGGPLSSA